MCFDKLLFVAQKTTLVNVDFTLRYVGHSVVLGSHVSLSVMIAYLNGL